MTRDRINKETGELSASGELSVSVELKTETVEGCCGNPELLQVLTKQIHELGIHTYSNSNDRISLEQQEEPLYTVLPLYIQVWTTRGSVYIFRIKILQHSSLQNDSFKQITSIRRPLKHNLNSVRILADGVS